MPRNNLEGDAPPVIVLGTGITALGVVRILARNRLHSLVAEPSDQLVRRSRWFRPLPNAPTGDERSRLGEWLPKLTVGRAVLMPCSDDWVSAVAALDPALGERFPASVSTPETLERFVDKGRFASLLRETATPHPFSKIVESEADLAEVPESVFDNAILKPRESQGFIQRFHVKAVHVRSRREAAEKLATLVNEGFPVILQEYISGPAANHYFVDGFIDQGGAVRAVFVRQRLRMYPADFGNSTSMVSVPVEAAAGAVASITSILRHVGYRGMFSAEFKRDPRDGLFKLLEVNARAWWYVDFAARCGVDVCRMAYDDALDRPITTIGDYRIGQRLVFPYHDYFACRADHERGELSRWRWMRSWVGAMQPVFQFRDPAPGFHSFVKVIAMFLKQSVRRLIPGLRPNRVD